MYFVIVLFHFSIFFLSTVPKLVVMLFPCLSAVYSSIVIKDTASLSFLFNVFNNLKAITCCLCISYSIFEISLFQDYLYDCLTTLFALFLALLSSSLIGVGELRYLTYAFLFLSSISSVYIFRHLLNLFFNTYCFFGCL